MKKNFIVSIKIAFDTVTDMMANNQEEAFEMVKEQLTEGVLLEAINKIKLKDGTKTPNTLNGLQELKIELDYVEEA